MPKPKDALAFLRRKKIVPIERWDEISGAEHAHAFTVSHVTNTEALEAIRGQLIKAMEDGVPYEKFRVGFLETMQKNGWYLNPERKDDMAYDNWRMGVIHDTNMRTSYSAGRYRQSVQISSMRPYWLYKQKQRPTKRQEHEPLHNLALPCDDSFWDKYYPPNGWGCECYVQTLSSKQYEAGSFKKEVPGDFSPATIPTEWQHNPGKEVLAPDFSKFSRLHEVKMPSGKTAAGEIAEIYQKEIEEFKLSGSEWKMTAQKILDTKEGLIHNQKTGKDEPGKLFKRPVQEHQYLAGTLDPSVAKAIGTTETKLMFSDQGLQHGRRWAKLRDAPEQVVSKEGVYALPRMMEVPDKVYFDPRSSQYLFFKNYTGLSEAGPVHPGSVIKGIFRKTSSTTAWELVTYLIVREVSAIDPGLIRVH
ncbi:MAG TPA: phage minor head protein [Rectinemataceae bacterium]|nr:phage minor head protein [Rectinemataceae bacterium]